MFHDFSGCERTSHVHLVRKPRVFQKYRKSNQFQKVTTIFGPVCEQRWFNRCRGTTYAFHNWSHKERGDNGCEVSCQLLQEAWREVCCQTRVTWTHLRCYSKTLRQRLSHCSSWCRNDLPPEQWRWKMSNVMCLPVQMTKPPTPHQLLKVIRCGCKITCTTRCTCITYGLKYTSIGTGCTGGTASGNTLYLWDCVHFSHCIISETAIQRSPGKQVFLNYMQNTWKAPTTFSYCAVSLSVYRSVVASINFSFCGNLNCSMKT